MNAFIRTLLLSTLMTLASTSLTQAQPPHAMTGQYALVFFHFSQCAECHHFAPTMKRLEQTTQLPVYDFSFDGQPIPGYATPIPTNSDITAAFFGDLKNAITPATFLINVSNGKYVRLSEGNVPYTELLKSYQALRADVAIMESLE
ncbi:conjugal transfer protein TraF [Vibrio splendidus]|uniref:conjugal transfer protein TraF n=1 Tax=Vibrio splendidus TaxID=29497 RepID=UPI00030B032E|nr:conjugal transfer protein TraF [Vibrio splendidus]PMM09364.1 type-F conjugative transfer system pilin assembly thiol-disulfide isomerase TrbB [Vibrio splendidus]PMN35123.1 type-F conjugative transfer system pilin assembly thiol-disulfide isomerase TrbB [Vibrio splendidus]